MAMREITEVYARVLLEHHRRVCRSRCLARKRIDGDDIDACLITYSELCNRAGRGVPAGSGLFLGELHTWCCDHKLPKLNSLAVKKATRRPGFNYPGEIDAWERDVRECISFTGYPAKIP
jgi:hypothetical protein